MKTVNKILRILVMVFGLASLVLFFTDFATISLGETSKTFVGAQLAFGSKVGSDDLARSAKLLFVFILTAITFVMSIFAGKSKKLRYAVSGVSLFTAIYMFVLYFLGPWKYVDPRPFQYNTQITAIDATPFVLAACIALALLTISAIAYLLLDDYLEVLASKGEKLTIRKRVIRFFRDYKSETKKIVWPGIRDVAKNTFIVLVMCLLVGALIWVVDFGLAKLLDWIWTL